MKAGIYYGVSNVAVEDRAVPEVGDKDVLVKVRRAGICGSDTGSWLHGGLRYGVFSGMVEGHEMVGEVAKMGPSASSDFHVGDIVWVDPSKARRVGKLAADVCGTFAEYVLVEDARQDYNLFLLDKNIDLDAAALIEPLAVGTQGALALDPKPDENVVVLGAGTIGLCAAAGLVNHGIKNVVVVDRNEWKLEIARKIGAQTVNSREENVADRLCDIFGEFVDTETHMEHIYPELGAALQKIMDSGIANVGAKRPNVQLYVDCAGAQELLQMAFKLCVNNTRYSIVSVYSDPVPVPGSIFMSQAKVCGSAGYTLPVIHEVIDHITNERTPIKDIITAKYSLDEFPKAMEHAAVKSYKNIKVLLDMDR
ncbi:MAG: zinc-dependent alcohol dehydrogenase [Tractidigestivibacter sp.]|jgi:threonine dehydrogenase-like Zn-dependent dehydrogenase|uniref:zinc-dependent alcohol dehydrogenase n=1 Tax=Tractidigestivibacter sp. TaxID=2847320 RepID=UPI003D8E02CB